MTVAPQFRTPTTLRRIYRVLAPVYDRLVPLVSSRARERGRTWLHVQDGEQVLDVGTGTGLALRPLVAANPSGWTEGLDPSPAMLTHARRRLRECPHRRYGLRVGDATALPYPDDTFDAVFSSYAVDVLPETALPTALAELRRVLCPEGRLALVYLAPPRTPPERLWATLARHCPPLLGGDRPIDLPALLPEHGFDVQAQTTCTQLGLRSGLLRARPT